MSLDDLYNHLKVYESEVQKKSKTNFQNMDFISSAKHSRGNEDVNTASVSTASTNVPTASANIRVKMALLSMRADRFRKKKISIQGTDVAEFDKSKVECFNCHKMGHFARECRAPISQDRGRRDNHRQGSKVEEQAIKALMAIDGGLDSKLIGFQTASKDLDSLLESQRLDKNKEGLGYSVVLPPPAQIYSPPKKDMSWTGLPEFKDDTVIDYSRPASTIESSLDDAQNRNPFVTETEASPSTISPKSSIKFVKANNSLTNSKIDKAETAKKPSVKKFSTVNRKFPTPNRKFPTGGTKFSTADMGKKGKAGSSQKNIDDKGYQDSGYSRHMIGNISYLSDYEPFDGGYVSFGQGGCKITGKGTIKTGKLEFENVYFMKDLKTPRQHNMYSIDLNNIVPHKDFTCLVAKAFADECMLWHRRL
nr:hypothetical protein [Tanacetum cinerariifolium]